MKTTSGTSVLPFSGPAPSSDMVSAAPQPDSSASFHEVLHQQGDDSSSANDSKSTTASGTNTASTASTPAAANATATASAKGSPVVSRTTTTVVTPTTAAAKGTKATLSVVSELSAMLVQAAALASNAQKAAPATTTPATGKDSDAATATTSDKEQSQLVPSAPDLATLIAQTLMLATNTNPTSVATTTATTISAKTDDLGKGATTGNALPTAATGSELSTMIAQASILASTSSSQTTSGATMDLAAKTGATVDKDLPILGAIKVVTTAPTKEKKSASTSDEGTFLQPGTDASSTASSLLGMLGVTSAQGGQSTGGEQLATGHEAKKSPLEMLAATASGAAGTANVEKKTAMNADQNIPQALSGLGANMVATPQNNTSDMQIKLSTNNDFNDALKQVMHVAQLTQTNESRTPMRVAIEIQTPPGAVVNVYVSKQNDQWRAQLSTNDPVALNWVQDKMTSLRQSNDLGVQVRWLPPQMEATSTSSGNDANLAWDRGGQGQSNYQQPDERQQNQQQEMADELADFAKVGSNFMNKLTAAGSAA